jgi:hypothetical protein
MKELKMKIFTFSEGLFDFIFTFRGLGYPAQA